MPKTDEPWVQLATRIPKDVHLRLKLHCVENDMSVMHFVVTAIEEHLRRKPKARTRKG